MYIKLKYIMSVTIFTFLQFQAGDVKQADFTDCNAFNNARFISKDSCYESKLTLLNC